MPASVVVIGLDAPSATLLERWAEEGFLPTIAHLQKHGGVSHLANSLETLPGAIWPELQTGRSCGKLGLVFHHSQFHTGEGRSQPITPEDVDASNYYWSVASQAGRRVAVIDQPLTVPFRGLKGVQVFEWGVHDRNFHIASQPPDLINELRKRHGDPPIDSCDLHGGTRDGYRRLLQSLIEGVKRKTNLILDVMGREEWDLFTCVFGESHCIGHQFWHFHDEGHPAHEADAPQDLRNALRSVYQQIDEGIQAVIDSAGPDARVIVVASHGMGPRLGGPQLLPEVLHRLGLSVGKPLRLRVGPMVPKWVRKAIKVVCPVSIPERFKLGHDTRYETLGGPHKRAIPVHNNRCGAIRLNLVGREPRGSVQPGAEAEALIAELRRELLALKDPASGELIVKRVITATEAFGPGYHPDVPDLMIVFRTDLGLLEACESDRVGLVRVPLWIFNPRTGDHTVESRLWAIGPGLPNGVRLPEGNVLGLAPTVLRLLDVNLPDWIDGQPLLTWSRTAGVSICEAETEV